MFVRLQIWRRLWLRRLISLAVIVSMCASFFPLPVASRTPGKDRSIPFPCQDRPCGCRSAEQCWKGCCCYSHTEKLAWARRNRVTPPRFMFEAAGAGAKPEVVASHRCCERPTTDNEVVCAESRPAKICDRRTASKACSCSTSQRTTAQIAEGQDDETEVTFALGVMVRRCQGSGLFWQSLPWSILPTAPMSAPRPAPVKWDHPVSVGLCQRLVEPPVPPPRLLTPILEIV